MAYRKLSEQEKAKRAEEAEREAEYCEFGNYVKIIIQEFKNNLDFFKEFQNKKIDENGLSSNEWETLSNYINTLKNKLEKINYLPINFTELPEVQAPQIKKLSINDLVIAQDHINGIKYALNIFNSIDKKSEKEELEHVSNLIYNHTIILMRDLQKK